jgi:hypothetical protein
MPAQTPSPPPPPTPAANQPASGGTTQQPVASAMLEVYQKNFAALTAAASTLSQGAATLFQAQQDALSSAVHQAGTASREAVAARAPQACPTAVAGFKQALDASLLNLQQMSALTEVARRNAFETIQARMTTVLQQGATPRSALLGTLTNQPAGTPPPTPPVTAASVAQHALAPASIPPATVASVAQPAAAPAPIPPATAASVAQPAAAPRPTPPAAAASMAQSASARAKAPPPSATPAAKPPAPTPQRGRRRR